MSEPQPDPAGTVAVFRERSSGEPFASLFRIEVDPDLPPNTMLMRSAGEQWIMDTSAPYAHDPAFAEDLASLRESAPFVVRFREGTDPIRCECCGTMVFAVPESEIITSRRWVRAIWEPQTGRKHTLRRCEATRKAKEPGEENQR